MNNNPTRITAPLGALRRSTVRLIHRGLDRFSRRSTAAQVGLAALMAVCIFFLIYFIFFGLGHRRQATPVVYSYSLSVPEAADEPAAPMHLALQDTTTWEASPYDAFVQMVNPSSVHNGTTLSASERVGVVLLYLFGAFILTGVIVTLMVSYVDNRRNKWLQGDVDVDLSKPFILIIGGHKMVPGLWMELKDKKDASGKPYPVVIQTRRVADRLRRELQSLGGECAESVIIKNGDRTSDLDIQELRPQLAAEIYIIGEDARLDGDNHDADSMQCLNLLEKWIGHAESHRDGSKTECHVMFEYQASTKIFQYTDIDLSNLEFIPFNFYEQWAEEVLVAPYERPARYKPLTGSDIRDFDSSNKRVHLVIIGMTKMGTMFGAKAAMLCHFPNFLNDRNHNRTLITFIDPQADTNMGYFRGRNSTLFDLCRWRYVDASKYLGPDLMARTDGDGDAPARIYQHTFRGNDPIRTPGTPYFDAGIEPDLMDIDWEFIKGDIANDAVRQYLRDCAADGDSVTTLTVCLPVTSEAVSAALFLPDEVYTQPNIIQILVQQESTDAIIEAASKEIATKFVDASGIRITTGKYTKLTAFGMLDSSIYRPRIISHIPAFLHYVYCQNYSKPEDIDPCTAAAAERIIKAVENPDGTEAGEIRKNYFDIANTKGKGRLAQMWSNVYNSLTVMLKCNFIDDELLNAPTLKLSEHKDLVMKLAHIEHSRWVMEQILVGFRPLRKDDAPVYFTGGKEGSEATIKEKDDYKIRFIHPDMHSFYATERPDGTILDPGLPIGTQLNDIVLTVTLPTLRRAILSENTKKERQ